MSKKVFYDADARQRILAGAEILYNAVKTTMGPKGRNVIIDKAYGNATVTHDGVTVAKSISITDTDETLGYKTGIELIKQAASKMGDDVGDGTTSVTVLTYHILNEANKLIAAGHSPMELRKGLENASVKVMSALEKLSEDVKDNKARIAEVGTISAGDKEIGDLIADVIDKVGKDGVVTVEAGQGLELQSEVLEGFSFDRGFISSYMVTDTSRQEAVYNKPAIVITDKKISNVQEFVPLIEKLAQSGQKNLVLIAEDVDGEALATLILNKLKGAFNTVAIKAPAFGDSRKEILKDIALLTGAKVISSDQGDTFDAVGLDVVGTARTVIVSKDKTTIIEGEGNESEVKARISQLVTQSKETKSPYEKEQFDKRRAALGGKVAVIKVGGATETEIEEKKFRVDDAVAAVKAAVSEGIVAGGGVTLLNIAHSIKLTPENKAKASVRAGEQLLVDALEQPFRTLLDNSGLSADEWLPQIKKSGVTGLGVNVNDENPELVDMKSVGVVDPTKVTKQVVQNAVSIAGTAITMGALVVEVPEKESAQPSMGMM